MLVASAVLGLIMPYPYVFARVKTGGMRWGVGNREDIPDSGPWVARADRAHKNYLENLPMFAIVALLAVMLGRTNQWTALGAVGFVGARVLYWWLYMAGVIWVRTLVFNVGVASTLLIAAQVALW